MNWENTLWALISHSLNGNGHIYPVGLFLELKYVPMMLKAIFVNFRMRTFNLIGLSSTLSSPWTGCARELDLPFVYLDENHSDVWGKRTRLWELHFEKKLPVAD